MAPVNSKYTLVGFCPELDWRPLSFVKPIPPNRLCGACGLVCKRLASLPCRHILCESCYKLCAEEGVYVCPLDGYECHDEDDVDWKDLPADQLLRREVRCWNEERGCTSVMAASDLFQHFQRECGHHSVSCPRCSTAVLCSDVCSHLRSGCEAKPTPLEPEAEVSPECKDETALVSTFRGALEKQAAESRRLFELLAVDTAAHGDRLSEVCHAINTLSETLTQGQATERQQTDKTLATIMRDITLSTGEMKTCFTSIGHAITNIPGSIEKLEKTLKSDLVKETNSTNDHLSQVDTSIKVEVKENTVATMDKIATFIGRLQATSCVFNVEGVEGLKQKALKKGWCVYKTKKVYLRGYCVSPGVFFRRDGECVKLCSRIVLHRGDMDDFLQWPFQHRVRLCVLHHHNGSKREYEGVAEPSLPSVQRPTQPCNRALRYTRSTLNLSDLISEGFVENDSLLVRWELRS